MCAAQLHFHRPSEHTIEGKRLPLEAHFVHKQIDGDLIAVLTVLYEESSSVGPTIGDNNTALAAVADSVPITPGEGQMLNQTVSPIDLLPPGGAYWRYVGSTTTPPCSEGVVWFILKNANVATPDQLSTFTEAAGGVNNNRPRQPLNGRLILT
jgi:carbonic anhydrase